MLAAAVEYVAGSVVVDVLGVQVALVVLVEVPAAHAVPPLVSFRTRVALWPLRPVVTLGALRAAVALVTLRALRAGIADVALRTLGPRRTGVALRPDIAVIALRTHRAVLAAAVEYVAGPVVIDVLGLEIASVVLVEVPAAHAVVPLGTLRPVVALRAAVAGIALRAL